MVYFPASQLWLPEGSQSFPLLYCHIYEVYLICRHVQKYKMHPNEKLVECIICIYSLMVPVFKTNPFLILSHPFHWKPYWIGLNWIYFVRGPKLVVWVKLTDGWDRDFTSTKLAEWVTENCCMIPPSGGKPSEIMLVSSIVAPCIPYVI